MKPFLLALTALLAVPAYAEAAPDTFFTEQGEQEFRTKFVQSFKQSCPQSSDNGTLTLQARENICACSAEKINSELSSQDILQVAAMPLPYTENTFTQFTQLLETDINTIIQQCAVSYIQNHAR